jgi:Leucine-rich repeat (LRR) protein
MKNILYKAALNVTTFSIILVQAGENILDLSKSPREAQGQDIQFINDELKKHAGPELRELNLFNNVDLTQLNWDLLSKCTNIKKLNIGANGLKQLPAILGALVNLTDLSLSHNKLKANDPNWDKISEKLERLSLEGCRFSAKWEKILKRFIHLKELNATRNTLGHNFDWGVVSKEIKKLTLGYGDIYSIPPEFSTFTNLTELDLSGNSLDGAMESFTPLSNLYALRLINLENNNIDERPEGIPQETIVLL